MPSTRLSSAGIVLDDRYEALVRLSPDALYILQDNRLAYINAAGASLLNAPSADQLIGLPLHSLIHPDFLDRVIQRVGNMLGTGENAPTMEQKYLRQDGSVIDVEVRSAPCLYRGKPAIQVIARDITNRKATEEALRLSEERHRVLARDANRARQSLQHEKTILEMIAWDKPLDEVLRQVCLGTEALLQQNARCSILLLEPDARRVRVAAGPSLPQPYNDAVNGQSIGPEAGSCGTAIFFNRPVIVRDVAVDPRWTNYRAVAMAHGLHACWSTPIRNAAGVAVGAFGVYYGEPTEPCAEDQALMDDVTHLVEIALYKERVERSLQQSEDRYRSVVTSLTEGIVVQSREGVVVACNPSAARILRVPESDLVGMRRGTHFKRIFAEDGTTLAGDELPASIVFRTGTPILGITLGMELHNGETVWVSQNVLPIHVDSANRCDSILISFTDITAVKEAQQRLRFMATHDALTGLPNRTYLSERLTTALRPGADGATPHVAVLFLDLDRFKNVNDTIGHEAGDRLLQSVAERLISCLGESETLARLGGDEFVVLIDQVRDIGDVTGLADRILHVISEIFVVEDNEYYLGVSIGISMSPDDGVDGATLLRCADSAMYHAKESGRNNYKFFSADMNTRSQQRYQLEKSLRRAISQREFCLHYQPKVDLRSGLIVGAEALLRWENPDVGLVSPNDFIPVAEDTGLIVPIGRWALEEACRQAAIWRRESMPALRIAVNLSPRQFMDDNLVSEVRDILQRHQLPAQALELEITERLLMGNSEKLMPVFDALTGMGISFSIDDFGTGYSSLSYLQRFPISNLKIDRSFISGIPADRDSVALTQAILAMAHALEMTVTAEGVESQNQVAFLKAAGCEEIQGFYFSRAVPADGFQRLLN